MNVTIEVVAAEATSLMASATVALTKGIFTVVTLISAVATSIVRSLLAAGNTSRNAVAPHNFRMIGGLAVA